MLLINSSEIFPFLIIFFLFKPKWKLLAYIAFDNNITLSFLSDKRLFLIWFIIHGFHKDFFYFLHISKLIIFELSNNFTLRHMLKRIIINFATSTTSRSSLCFFQFRSWLIGFRLFISLFINLLLLSWTCCLTLFGIVFTVTIAITFTWTFIFWWTLWFVSVMCISLQLWLSFLIFFSLCLAFSTFTLWRRRLIILILKFKVLEFLLFPYIYHLVEMLHWYSSLKNLQLFFLVLT